MGEGGPIAFGLDPTSLRKILPVNQCWKGVDMETSLRYMTPTEDLVTMWEKQNDLAYYGRISIEASDEMSLKEFRAHYGELYNKKQEEKKQRKARRQGRNYDPNAKPWQG